MSYAERVGDLFKQTDSLLAKVGLRVSTGSTDDGCNFYYLLYTHPNTLVHIQGFPGLSGSRGTHVMGRLLNNWEDGEVVEKPSRFSSEVPDYDPHFLVNLITTNLAKEKKVPQKD